MKSSESDRKQMRDRGLVFPRYDSYCLSNVTPTVLSIFGVETGRTMLPADVFGDIDLDPIEKVVLMIVDGLGYREWRNQRQDGMVRAMEGKGSVRAITSVFPSTTAAALTSLSTGLTPQEHCLPEWFVYFRELDMIIATLPFTPIGEAGRDTLLGVADPKMLFRGEPVYQKLKRAGVPTLTFVNRQIAGSAYSSTSLAGSRSLPYVSSSDLVVNLRRQVEVSRGPGLFYVYWSFVDTVEHRFGPNTDETTIEASTIFFAMKRGFLDKLNRRTARKTLLLVTADHGQVNVSPDTTLFLNSRPKLVRSFEEGPSGRPILPSGSARDVFLHIREDRLDETYQYLVGSLDGKAEVLRTDDAVNLGLFGTGSPKKEFMDRVGNIVLLPKQKRTIWYRHTKDSSFELRGHHGGLTKDEMMIPFAAALVSDLQP